MISRIQNLIVHSSCLRFQSACMSAIFVSTLAILLAGCHVQPPGGAVVEPQILGTTVDEIMQRQEENAERAKLIVYMHEFEINLQDEIQPNHPDDKPISSFEYRPPNRIRGYQLTPSGQDHLRQIAFYLNSISSGIQPFVTIERSTTSKRWQTKHQYPVHFNDELDSARRQVVVNVLTAFGVTNADQIVVVAPAYPTGLNAEEAAGAYRRGIGNYGASNGQGFRF